MSGTAQKKGIIRTLFGDADTIGRYPWVNTLIEIYVFISVLVFCLFEIAPFITMISWTPFYSIKSYLGIIGAVLLVLDALTNRGLWRPFGCWILYAIVVAGAVSSYFMRRYGLRDNVYFICWFLVQIGLVYSIASRMGLPSFRRYLKWFLSILTAVWTVACLISLFQYLCGIGYVYRADEISNNPELVRQGFYAGRLFGVFRNIDYAAYICLFLCAGCVFLFRDSRHIITKILSVLCFLVMITYVVVSGSRSARIAFLVYVFVYVLLSMIISRKKNRTRVILVILVPILVTAVFTIGYKGSKVLWEKAPAWFDALTHYSSEDDSDMDSAKETDTGIGKEKSILYVAPRKSITNTNKNKKNDTSLDRDDLEGDKSNARFKIWKDYLSMWKDYGLFGLSFSNYNDYISETHPDLFIVRYFQEKYAQSDKSDLVYESHNNYLYVFVVTGLVGGALFLVFLFVYLIRAILFLVRKIPDELFLVGLAISGMCMVDAMFMNGAFFKLNAISCFNWLAMGTVLMLIRNSKIIKKDAAKTEDDL